MLRQNCRDEVARRSAHISNRLEPGEIVRSGYRPGSVPWNPIISSLTIAPSSGRADN